jgi:phage terminase small subunit
MKGPQPQPTVLKILRGNPGKRRLPENEPKPEPGIPDMPAWIKSYPLAEECWHWLVEQLGGMGVLCKADGRCMELYCSAYSTWREDLCSVGRMRALQSLGSELGLSPAARTRIKTIGKRSEPNQLEQFLANSKAKNG